MSTTPSRPQRLLRISRACDFCHKRRIKCQDNPDDDTGRCRNCVEFDIACTYARPSRRGRAATAAASTSPVTSLAATARKPPYIYATQHPPATLSGVLSPGSGSGSGSGLSSGPSPNLRLGPPSPHTDRRITMAERSGGCNAGYGGRDDDDSAATVYTAHLSSTWQAFAHTTTPALKRLVAVYHETVFPIFPFFDPVRLQRRLDQLEHVTNRAFFCSVMAACALASARARDGALSTLNSSAAGSGTAPGSLAPATATTASSSLTQSPSLSSSSSPPPPPPALPAAVSSVDMPPEMFYAAADEALPKDILQCHDFEYLRALALLSIASIQDARIAVMQKYIGHYFTLLAVNQWHDEANWPPGLDPIEVEERRRLYWSIYTLDVFTSIIFDGCIHFQESHSRVDYPTGLAEPVPVAAPQPTTTEIGQGGGGGGGGFGAENSEADNTATTTTTTVAATTTTLAPSPRPRSPSWMVGWNFTTDLYRILEHNLNKLRSRASRFGLLGEAATPGSFRASSQARVAELYAALPPVFKHIQPATGDPARDIFSFQAANIQATMALLEMVHLSLEADVDLERKCSVVHHVLQTFHQVPRAYLRAISSPLVYHIGGIGVILGTVMEGSLSADAYRLVRDLLLSMAVLLESLEAFLHRSAGAGRRLRSLVARLEHDYVRVRSSQNHDGRRTSGDSPSSARDRAGDAGAETPVDGDDNSVRLDKCAPKNSTMSVAATYGSHVSQVPAQEQEQKQVQHPSQPQQQQQQQQQRQQQRQQLMLPPISSTAPPHPPAKGYSPVSLAATTPTTKTTTTVQSSPGTTTLLAQRQQQPSQPSPPPQMIRQQNQNTGGAQLGLPNAQQQLLSPAYATAAAAAAASMYPPQPQPAADGPPRPAAPWATTTSAPLGLVPDPHIQIQVPDELLQDWTWPFAVSNNYLSF